MKVKIGPYLDWIGPYQIAEKILFWIPKYKKDTIDPNPAYEKYVDPLGDFLAASWLNPVCQWIYNKRKRTIKVKIDRYDTWSMDCTLALIILPMLKQLREHKHGAPFVDNEDVPWYLRSHFYTKENEYDTDPAHFKRWDWIMDEMIWTFEQLVDDDWESRYHHGEHDIQWKECEDNPQLSEMVKGPKDTHWWDVEGYKKHQERINNGLRLFGRYYQGLWS